MNKIHTLQQRNKTVSVVHYDRHYVIGFRNPYLLRKVHYSMHPEPKLILLRDNDTVFQKEFEENGYDISLTMDFNATLFIPKCAGSTLHPMNDGGYHMNSYKESDFLAFPIRKRLGIIMPYKLEDEDDKEFMFKVCVIDPMNNNISDIKNEV